MKDVKVWEEDVVIPTYPVGMPEKNPMFLEKRVYQGSSGVVYPHAVIEKIYDEKIDKSYHAVFLENAYIKVMILPELGGRIQMAYDKVKERHFVYYNQVIKPALVGLTGPWISGGIEFNWPQHHRPSTFEPIDFTIKENEDGSKTVWVNEVERMFRTKGMAGFTLYPDRAYIEITGKLYNRTPVPQTFLWWANPAVKVNDHYQSVFPPDVYAVFDHGKRDVSSFPIAKGVYYKVDYSPGTDISRYKNIPVPTSYMAINSKYNFIGGYENDSRAGLLHVANHHISPGKKQWTWGHAEFGRSWDKNLTDEDGPYIELMTGIYTDNQPDFSWLQPYEEKQFVQYFMPYQEVGVVKNATKEAVVNMEVQDSNILDIRLYVTTPFAKVKVAVIEKGVELFSDVVAVAPEAPYLRIISLEQSVKEEHLTLMVTNMETNRELISYQQEVYVEKEIPDHAQAAKLPGDVENNEQLYLTGLHLEQYRHATYSAKDYYEEALRRDPKDLRNNNALGLWYFRRGQFAKAEGYFRKAVTTLTQRNPNPYDGEPAYNLGMALKMQYKLDEAFDAFYKCVWNDACQHAGYLNLARIACERGDFEEALEVVDRSLIKNYHSHTARHLKTVVLRKLGRVKAAQSLIEESLTIDPFNFGCLFERYLLLQQEKAQEATAALEQLLKLSRNWVHNFIEYAFDYAHAGQYTEAAQLLEAHLEAGAEAYPMVYYYMGWFAGRMGLQDQAIAHYQKAATLNPYLCFPNRIEDVVVLQAAMAANPSDAKAPYYLGNFWYDKRQYDEALNCWELSVKLDNTFPTVHRNLSLAYFNRLNDPAKALASLEKAFTLDPTDARVLMELDQLYKRLNTPHTQRLELLEKYLDLTVSRDDLYLERVTLYNLLGKYKKAKSLLAAHKFHPWEGGEGKVVSQYLICHIELAKQAIEANEYDSALQLLEEAETYPENLGEGKLPGVQENDIHYLKGLVYEMRGEENKAQCFFQLATEGISVPVQAIFYNDPQPDKIVYQGLAWLKLGDKNKADERFHRLIDFGKQHMNDQIRIDYFAVSLPELLVFDIDLNLRNRTHCLYLMALGQLGLGMNEVSDIKDDFDKVLQHDSNHQGAIVHKQMANFLFPIANKIKTAP
jgi:tetratricopeptide (TPR) repeat protein